MKSLKESLLDDEDVLVDKTSIKDLIIEWLDLHDISNYRIIKNISGYIINCKGSILLQNITEQYLPDYIQFGQVTGTFILRNSNIKNLKGIPYSVGKLFLSNLPDLENLDNISTNITDTLIISNCPINSLKGMPGKIKNITIERCDIKNLIGISQNITYLNIFNCNKLNSLKGCPPTLFSLTIRNCKSLYDLNYISKRGGKLRLEGLGKSFDKNTIKKYCEYKVITIE